MTTERVKECLLPLNGVHNFRDMGGLKTSDGRKVKRGILFRAAELTGLTEEDKKYLESIDFKCVFDYRRRGEAERKPDPVIGKAVNERVSVMEEDNITTYIFKEDGDKEYYSQFTAERFLRIYGEMPIQNQSYKRLMERLKNPEENLPLVHHCTGGRDRTGVGAMIILMTLGVPYETALEDYLLSNIALEDYHNRIFDKTSAFFTKEELDAFKNSFPLREDYLHSAFDAINTTYGDFDTYIQKEFGITKEIRKNIQDYCLE
ncbi:tyrosine-protein phosphatase [Bacillus dakarensis]|uniref:tyrosine-protein phosphatase n=1 Tax=Robertmurraya dakarensis TaxID=1926278 RepID=UPI0009811152|nr:tyrosine-protein phosphatase [Bacillus dakarensis]